MGDRLEEVEERGEDVQRGPDYGDLDTEKPSRAVVGHRRGAKAGFGKSRQSASALQPVFGHNLSLLVHPPS